MRESVENPMVNYKDESPKPVATCEQCKCTLFEDEVFLKFDGDYFCEDDCFMEFIGVETVEGNEI